MPLTGEARANLTGYTQRLLERWGVDSGIRTRLSIRTHKRRGIKKDRDVVAIRDRLIWDLWTRCWQGCGGFLVDQDDPGGDWQHLSHPNIAAVLGLDHNTVTRSLNRTRERRQKEKQSQKTAREATRWDETFRQIRENQKLRKYSFGEAHTVESRHDTTR